MKMRRFSGPFLAVVAGLALLVGNVPAQDSPATAAPRLSYGASQILQLAQAKISDDTIIAYIHNSGNSFGLNADQIIYLRQQGVSNNVLNTMLNQPKAASTPAQPATQPNNSYTAQTPNAYVQPTTTVYVVPDTQTYYYNNYYYARPYYYSYYPYYYPCYVNPFFVSFSFGFHNRFHDFDDFRGGFHRGGFHGAGGFHR